MQRERVFDLVGGEEAQLDEDRAQPLAVAHGETDGALEVGCGQAAVADEDLAHAVLTDAGIGVDDVAVAEPEAAAVGTAVEREHSGLPADVKLAQQARQYAFAKGSVHGHREWSAEYTSQGDGSGARGHPWSRSPEESRAKADYFGGLRWMTRCGKGSERTSILVTSSA